MPLKLLVVILFSSTIAGAAYAQSAVTNEDAQKVIETISRDKEKVRAYCDMVKLGRQMDAAGQRQDQENADEQDRMNQLAQTVGPEFGAMMDEYKDIDLSSEQGQETGAMVQATIETLNKLCGSEFSRPERY
jgi:ribosomal protein L17